MIYLRHHLERSGLDPGARVGVLPLVNGWLRHELCAELRSALPVAEIEVAESARGGRRYDLVVLPLTRGLHRAFFAATSAPLLRGLRQGARAFLVYDVVRRRADVVRRGALPAWYARRLCEYLVVQLGRGLGWRRS